MKITEADFENPVHAKHIVWLTNQYALDPMGGGKALPDDVQERMVEGLKNHPGSLVFIAYDDEDQPVGIANCFTGYSTFAAQKLINIHDLAVIPSRRGEQIGEKLLKTVENKAREIGASALTLEVLENNPARRLYSRFGFKTGDPHYLFAKKAL